MHKELNEILTIQERIMLQDIMQLPSVHPDAPSLILYQVSPQLNAVISENLAHLVVKRGSLEFKYPLLLSGNGSSDDENLLELGLPDIIDTSGTMYRHWRSNMPNRIMVQAKRSLAILGKVENISLSGISISCSTKEYALLQTQRGNKDLYAFYLRVDDHELFPVVAKLARVEDTFSSKKIGLMLDLDSSHISDWRASRYDKLEIALQEFIFSESRD